MNDIIVCPRRAQFILKMLRSFACFSLPYRIHFRRIHITFILLIVCCGLALVLHLSGYGLFYSSSHFEKTLRVKYVKQVGNYSSACRLPNLNPFHPSILEFVKDLGKLQCKGERYSFFINDLLEVKGQDIYSVQYRTIERPHGDDFKVVLSDATSLSNEAEPVNDENSANTGEINSILSLMCSIKAGFPIHSFCKNIVLPAWKRICLRECQALLCKFAFNL